MYRMGEHGCCSKIVVGELGITGALGTDAGMSHSFGGIMSHCSYRRTIVGENNLRRAG